MTKTWALLFDSYRELNAKRLFWVVLGLSALVAAVFAALGLSNGSVTLLGWATPVRTPFFAFITPATFYKWLFVNFGVGFWLSWLAAILALVSTAGIFPDLMAGGSIDLYLSKPISRLWLFGTKVLGGLLFVTLQVTVFCLCCFLVLGVRGGAWQPGLFVAVPLVVLMFSYLFAVCVLIGVVTRSTIAALLLTLLFWVVIATAQWSERLALFGRTMVQDRAAQLDRQVAAAEADVADARDRPATTTPAAMSATAATMPAATGSARGPRPRGGGSWLADLLGGGRRGRRQTATDLAGLRDERRAFDADRFATAHAVLAAVVAPMPKTWGTIEVMERQLVLRTDLPPVASPAEDDASLVGAPDGPPGQPRDRQSGRGGRPGEYEQQQVDVQLRQRSAAWILGSSVAFEAAVLGLAAWLFCRRDY